MHNTLDHLHLFLFRQKYVLKKNLMYDKIIQYEIY